MKMQPVGISMGDPAGIGPEVILKALHGASRKPVLIIGGRSAFERMARRMHQTIPFPTIDSLAHYQGGCALLDIVKPCPFDWGEPSRCTAHAALQSIDFAIQLVKTKKIRALVTAPIWKAGIREYRRSFVGHTEYLAQAFQVAHCAMLGVSGDKRILLLTTHLPLRRMFKHVTAANIIKHVKMLDRGLRDVFRVRRPRIGVAGLNPHGREFSLGEDETIMAAVRQARCGGLKVLGPLPADTLFNQHLDGYLALYHDQAMIYLKSRPGGVNFTLGLPFVRTSPLHGTAFDIAGRGRADPRSMIDAIKLAFQLSRN